MNQTTVSVFNSTITKTNEWLREIMLELNWDDHEKAYKALRVVLHTLRDRLPLKEVTDLSAQLPMLIRGMYFEGWNPHHKSKGPKKLDQFVDEVNSHFPEYDYCTNDFSDCEEITRAVLNTLTNHVSSGEIEDVIGCLPKGLRDLWE